MAIPKVKATCSLDADTIALRWLQGSEVIGIPALAWAEFLCGRLSSPS